MFQLTDAEINAQIEKNNDNLVNIFVGHINALAKVVEAQTADCASMRARLEALEQRPHFERPNEGR